MEIYLKDGSGNGFSAKVTEDYKLETQSVTSSLASYESERHGDAFILSTNFISLTTTASFNGILYVKNTESSNKSLYIEQIRVCGGLCAGASTMQVRILKNPTAGTLISDQNAGFAENANTLSGKLFSGDFYVASADGKTITDGAHWSNFQGHAPGHSLQEYDGTIIIGRNDSLAIELKPSVSMSVCMEIICYYK